MKYSLSKIEEKIFQTSTNTHDFALGGNLNLLIYQPAKNLNDPATPSLTFNCFVEGMKLPMR